MFDDEDGVADVAYRAQRIEQPVRIARVQPYRRLVEHVEDARELRAYLRREAYALALSAGERVRAAREAQIARAYVVEEGETLFHLDERDADDFLLARAELKAVEHLYKLVDRHLRELPDVVASERDGERLRLEPRAFAGRADVLDAVTVKLFFIVFGFRLVVALFYPRDEPHVLAVVFPVAAAVGEDERKNLVGAVEHRLLRLARQLAEGPADVPAFFLRELLSLLNHVLHRLPRYEAPFRERKLGVHGELRREVHVKAEAAAVGAGSRGSVEREKPRFDVRQAYLTDGTDVLLRQLVVGHSLGDEQHEAVRELERHLYRFAEARTVVLAHLHAVDEALYSVAALFVELDGLFEPVERAVDARAHVALLVKLQQQVLVFALLRLDDGRVYLKRLPVIFLEYQIYNLVDAVTMHLASAFRTVRRSRAAEEQTQIVVYLRDCADCRTRVVARALLLYRDSRREARYVVDVGLVRHSEELPRVG